MKKRSGTKSDSSSFARIGWLAAAALGIGWAATDGRALTYLEFARSAVEDTFSVVEAPQSERTASAEKHRPKAAREAESAATERTRMPTMRPQKPEPAAQRPRVAAIAPSPAPRLQPMRMPRETVGRTADDAPPATQIDRPSASIAPQPAHSMSAGAERHATRRLDVRATPADGARVVATIDTGTSVKVMRSDGRWRYVKSTASRAEGWVDGGYLAGESATADTGGWTPISFRRDESPPIPRLVITSPLPPMSVESARR